MHTAKQDALAAIQRLPEKRGDGGDHDRLYVLENIRRGRKDAAQGKTIPAEEYDKARRSGAYLPSTASSDSIPSRVSSGSMSTGRVLSSHCCPDDGRRDHYAAAQAQKTVGQDAGPRNCWNTHLPYQEN